MTDPRKYVSKIIESYERIFSQSPRKQAPPLEAGDHQELDQSDFCNEEEIKQYQTLIGQLQWLISFGRFDIAVHTMSLSRLFGQLQWALTLGRYDILAHVMSMSCFRLAPKVGNIERMKRIYGYLSRTKHYALRFRTDQPNYMHLPDLEYDWTRICGNFLEEIPKDAPEPLGKSVTTTTFLDANLLHDLITGRFVTAVLHFFNRTPGNWYSKRQATVENATYG